MDQDPSSNNKDPKSRTRTTGPNYLQQEQEQELDKNKECGTLAYQGNY